MRSSGLHGKDGLTLRIQTPRREAGWIDVGGDDALIYDLRYGSPDSR